MAARRFPSELGLPSSPEFPDGRKSPGEPKFPDEP